MDSSRSSTLETRIFRTTSPNARSLKRSSYFEHAENISSRQSISFEPWTRTQESQVWAPTPLPLRIASSPSASSPARSTPPSPDPGKALHSHPTSPNPALQTLSLSRKSSADSFTIEQDEPDTTEAHRLSTIPEHGSRLMKHSTHQRTSTADSHRSIPTNFSRPFSARDSGVNSRAEDHRPTSSRNAAPLVIEEDAERVAEPESELRTQSRSSQLSAGSSASKRAKYSSRGMFGFPTDDDNDTRPLKDRTLVSADGSTNSKHASTLDSGVSLGPAAPPFLKPALKSSSSHSSTWSGLSATKRIESDGENITPSSSASSSSRAYPPSLSSDYTSTSAPTTNREASADSSTKTSALKGRPKLPGRTFSASTYDTSGLSEKKLQKLRKKGIDPALHLEMKAALGKKSKLGAPLGNAPL